MKAKTLTSLALALSSAIALNAKNDIKLPDPSAKKGQDIMETLRERRSDRECRQDDIKLQDLSDLLWAANGINRPDEGKRTAPSARNMQEIDIYVISADGAYKYDAASHSLKFVTEGDHRAAVAGMQDFVNDFPISLVLVADVSKFGDKGNERAVLTGGIDAGIVCQNINLFCAAAGLATVPRMSMDSERLSQILKLSENEIPMLNNPVGYKK